MVTTVANQYHWMLQPQGLKTCREALALEPGSQSFTSADFHIAQRLENLFRAVDPDLVNLARGTMQSGLSEFGCCYCIARANCASGELP